MDSFDVEHFLIHEALASVNNDPFKNSPDETTAHHVNNETPDSNNDADNDEPPKLRIADTPDEIASPPPFPATAASGSVDFYFPENSKASGAFMCKLCYTQRSTVEFATADQLKEHEMARHNGRSEVRL